jgi:hypothetical protein
MPKTPREKKTTRLQRRVGLDDEGVEVLLEPGAGLRGGRVRVRERAGGVVACRRAVAGAVTLASGLDPHNGVDEGRAGVRGRADTEASTLDVAPVTPCLTEVLLTRAAHVSDEVCPDRRLLAIVFVRRASQLNSRESVLRQEGRKSGDVEHLVVVGVVLGNRVRR